MCCAAQIAQTYVPGRDIREGQKLKAQGEQMFFCSSLNTGHGYVSLVPTGATVDIKQVMTISSFARGNLA
jgi:hypothetical protein